MCRQACEHHPHPKLAGSPQPCVIVAAPRQARGDDGAWKRDDGAWKFDDGDWMLDDGAWKFDDGAWKLDDVLLPGLIRR